MAIQFQRLATPGEGVNTLLDFAPLAGAIGDYQTQRKSQLIGDAARTGGNTAAAQEAMKQGQLDTGAQYTRIAQQETDRATQSKDRQIKMLGGIAQAAKFEKDPQRRALLWQTGLKRAGVNPADLDPEELDPMTGPDVFLAASGMAQDPRESQLMDLKIAQANKSLAAPVGPETPANVREWEYFQRLSPEQQQNYIAMKRQNSAVVGDTLLNRTTGGEITNVGEALARGEAQKEIGTAQGKAAAAAPSDISSAETALELITSIRNDPARSTGTGLSSVGNVIPGTAGYGFQKKVDQATSGAFLSAIQQLRGMGALSNAEGQTATAAVTRLTTGLEEGDFVKALDDYEKIVRKGQAAAAQRLQAAPGAQPTAQPQQARPDPLGLFGEQ